tara:strand:- start:40 stop:297 length:258 start_codon:yes stop_codon:yes gene_type:complete
MKKKTKKLKTTTLFYGDNPSWVICPGHVTYGKFNQAFKNEGWFDRGSWGKDDIAYEYWRQTAKGGFYRSTPGTKGAEPYTVARWD